MIKFQPHGWHSVTPRIVDQALAVRYSTPVALGTLRGTQWTRLARVSPSSS